jgi:hypothetical protein
MDAEETVVVFGTNDVSEAEIIRNTLRAAGMTCELEGELQGGFTGLVETRLLVPAGDADRARRLIKRPTIDEFEPPTDERTCRGR